MINEEGLRDWFGKSKSKGGKKGWVNVVTGGTCASDKPGEGTPKCVSSAKRASMSKKERLSAQRRKKAADPGQQQKSGAAKPTYVPTDKPKKKMKEETVIEAKDKPGSGSGKKDACYHKVKSRYSVWPSAYASGALVKCRKKGAANWGNKSEGMEEFYNLPELTEAQIGALKYAGYDVEVVDEAITSEKGKAKMKSMLDARTTASGRAKAGKGQNVADIKHIGRSNVDGLGGTPPNPKVAKNPVKSRSYGGTGNAAARRVSALKKEEVTGGILIQDKEDFKPREIETVDIIKPEPMKGISEATRTKAQTGNMYQVIFGWRGKMMMVKLFFPEASVPNRQKVADALDKMYPGSQLRSYSMSVVDYDDPYINVGEETDYNQEVQDRMDSDDKRKRTQMRNKHRATRLKQNRALRAEHSDWRTELEEDKGMEGMTQKGGHKRSTESGAGLTQKGVEKYRRQNPGSKLKTAVTTPPSKLKPGSKAAGRRKSFCARSRSWTGERGKAARRRWNC